MQRQRSARRARFALVAAALIAGIVLAGCGGSGGGTTASSGGSTDLAAIQKKVDTWLSPKGTMEPPPATGPKPEPGKSVALISCGQNITSCSIPIENAQEAASAMGWDTAIYDSKGDYGNANNLIHQALVTNPDAIFIYYIDCKYMQSGLKQAMAENIPVVAAESFDCNYHSNGPKLFTGQVTYVEGPLPKWGIVYGESGADYAINHYQGKADAIAFVDQSGLASTNLEKGVEQAFDACSECSLHPDHFPISTFNTGFQQRTQQLLLKYPDTNTILASYEAIILAGVNAAVQQSGKDALVYVGEGGPGGTDLVRSQNAYGSGVSGGWEAYAGMDAVNRLLHGDKVEGSGIGIQLFDKDHNTPAKGKWLPPIDYKADYFKTWGVKPPSDLLGL